MKKVKGKEMGTSSFEARSVLSGALRVKPTGQQSQSLGKSLDMQILSLCFRLLQRPSYLWLNQHSSLRFHGVRENLRTHSLDLFLAALDEFLCYNKHHF